MKTLILSSALISSIALTSGCIIVDDSSEQGAIGAAWNIKTNDRVGACPPGFDTARVISRPFGRNDSAGDKIDLFNCSAGRGLTAPLQAGAYVVWVEITDNSGANVYAQSAPANVDITNADKDVSYDIHTDKGFYFMNWALRGKSSNSALQCAQVPDLSKIALDASTTVGQAPLSTTFDCLQEQGYSTAIAAGVYQLAVSGINSQEAAVTDTTTIASKQITAPNRFTDLGTVVILAPGL
jgi:hypothetical protein